MCGPPTFSTRMPAHVMAALIMKQALLYAVEGHLDTGLRDYNRRDISAWHPPTEPASQLQTPDKICCTTSCTANPQHFYTFVAKLLWLFAALQHIHSKSKKWSLDFDLLWICSGVVANHRSDCWNVGQQICEKDEIYKSTTFGNVVDLLWISLATRSTFFKPIDFLELKITLTSGQRYLAKAASNPLPWL